MSIPCIRMSGIPYSTRHNVDFNITTFTLMELARLSSHVKMVRQMMSEYTRLYTLYVTNRDMYCTYVLTPLQACSLRYVEHRIFFETNAMNMFRAHVATIPTSLFAATSSMLTWCNALPRDMKDRFAIANTYTRVYANAYAEYAENNAEYLALYGNVNAICVARGTQHTLYTYGIRSDYRLPEEFPLVYMAVMERCDRNEMTVLRANEAVPINEWMHRWAEYCTPGLLVFNGSAPKVRYLIPHYLIPHYLIPYVSNARKNAKHNRRSVECILDDLGGFQNEDSNTHSF